MRVWLWNRYFSEHHKQFRVSAQRMRF
jgi:hypothetical protein